MIVEAAVRYISTVNQPRMAGLLLFGFTAVCVFDPADQILGVKVPLFIALCGATLLGIPGLANKGKLLTQPTIYVAAFVAIPMLSLLRYYLLSGHLPPQGFPLLKGYLLISLVIVLVVNRFDLIPLLSAALAVLALLVIAVFIVIQLDYSRMYNALQPVGLSTGLFYLDERSYGSLHLLQVFFATSPMLVVPIAYYFDRAMSESAIKRRLVFFAVTLVSIVGMFLAGTRNNILVSVLLPLLIWPLYSTKPGSSALYSAAGIAILGLLFVGHLKEFFDPTEFANNIKLITLKDYIGIFGDPATLWLGQGLGANYDWSARGQYFITELTYFEIIRNFGLIGGIPILAMLLLPLANAILSSASRRDKALAVAYFLYLVMSAFNPILFSSMGILILAALMANVFSGRDCPPGATIRSRP
jgi:hypothetical protein